jgi:hypothetical protein
MRRDILGALYWGIRGGGLVKRIASFVILGFALVACAGASVSGGGWGDSRNGSGKANFAFDIVCDEEAGTVSGSFVYNDKAAGSPWGTVALKGTYFDYISSCETAPDTFTFSGPYTAQNKACREGGCTGSYSVTAHDQGDKGANKGDTLSISLYGGVYDGYTNSGAVKGGNLKVGS